MFSHGQLDVSLSRCGDEENLFGPQKDEEDRMWYTRCSSTCEGPVNVCVESI